MRIRRSKSVMASLSAHIQEVANLIEGEVRALADKYRQMIATGQPLPIEAVLELDQIVKDFSLLLRPARSLRNTAVAQSNQPAF